jgi:hypothetical protein
MRRFPFSDEDRLLSGDLDPDDAPPELARIAGLIRASRVPGSPSELAGQDLLVSEVAAVVREARRVEVARGDRRHLLSRVLSAKVIAATTVVLLSGGVAAAATGALPTPVQRAVSHGLAHVGISVPDPAAHSAPAARSSAPHLPVHATNTTSNAVSGSTHSRNTVNRYGLCTTYAHATVAKARANALSKLTPVAQAHDETVAQYCQGATPPSKANGATSGSAHRPTPTTSVSSSTQARNVHGSRGARGQTPTGSTNGNTSKHATASSTPPHSSRAVQSSTNRGPRVTTTSTARPAIPPGHSPTVSDTGKGVSPGHTP